LIRVERVVKRFDGPVLQGVNLVVPGGCLYGLVGPGAAGKSVLLKIVAGLLRPDGGSVVVGGADLSGLDDLELSEYRKGVGMVFQNNALFDFMTVAENVAFPLRRLFDLPEPEIRRRVAERLASVGLGNGFGERLPAGLSGGQKKRVGVARATIAGAPIVLCDEPTAGLDPVTSQRLFDLLRGEQQRANSTVLMVSSDVDRLLTVTDRVGMMHEGRMVFDGTTEEARASTNPLVRQFLRGEIDGPL
jgi:phospholipid/cholesterol/gamma-HCH transport system ATP-binding protein